MRLSVILSFIIVSSIGTSNAQNAYVRLGQQAFFERDFKAAIKHLERACLMDSTNANALWMLGYSYYHSESYKKSVVAYTKAISINPADAMAYYYRARAKSFLAKEANASAADKEKYLLGCIVDLTKSIAIDPGDMKFYQNRGIAYREYAVFKLQSNTKFYDRSRGINSLRASVADFERVLNDSPSRADIASLIELSKEKLAVAVGHH
jgi:tetratricopeptide (TPR) repeat protein